MSTREVLEFKANRAIIDADSLIYLIAFTDNNLNNCCKRLMKTITDMVETLECEDALVFIKGKDNFRFEVNIDYKATRKEVPPRVKELIDGMYLFAEKYFVKSDNGEADDYCGIYHMEELKRGGDPVVCHIDKDLNALPGWHYNYRKKEYYFVEMHEAYLFLMTQLITGDSTDNIIGMKKGVGPITANKMLNTLTYDQMLPTLLKKWEETYPHTWQSEFTKCANQIYIRTELEDMRPLTFEEMVERLTWEGDERINMQSASRFKLVIMNASSQVHIPYLNEEI